jgi:hypothetical protein
LVEQFTILFQAPVGFVELASKLVEPNVTLAETRFCLYIMIAHSELVLFEDVPSSFKVAVILFSEVGHQTLI